MFQISNFTKFNGFLKSKASSLKLGFSKRKKLLALGFFAIAMLILAWAIFSFTVGRVAPKKEGQQREARQQGIITKEKANFPLAKGRQTYFIRTDRPTNPQVLQISLDPLDVEIGKEQLLKVKVRHTDKEAITNKNAVIATYYTDNGSSTIRLKLRRVDGPPLTTFWEGRWAPNDSYEFVYQARIEAISAAGQSRIDLSFR